MVNYIPTNLSQALEYLSKENLTLYGGGTDLMVWPDKNAKYLFLDNVGELKKITQDDQYIKIGSACTFTQVMESDLCPTVLREAMSQVAAPAIRNLGTMGGNVGNGSAKADSVVVFYALKAKIKVASIEGERIIPIENFYKGNKDLDISPNEIITEIMIPKGNYDNYFYHKVGPREALSIARTSFVGIIELENDKIINISTAFGAIMATILACQDLDKMFIGKTLKEAKDIKEKYIKAYDEAIVPIRGRVSSEYRKAVCLNLLKEFLNKNNI